VKGPITDQRVPGFTWNLWGCRMQKSCKPVSSSTSDAGYGDNYRGWYDVQGCGKCNDYCRWVGKSGSGGDPSARTSFGSSYWSCRPAGEATSHTPKGAYGSSFSFPKCAAKSGQAPKGPVSPPPPPPPAIGGNVLQEFGGSSCASGKIHKTIELRTNKWTFVGAWQEYRMRFYIFLMLGDKATCATASNIKEAKYTGGSCVMLAQRWHMFKTPDDGRNSSPLAYSKTSRVGTGTLPAQYGYTAKFPKIIGAEGQCFVKCRAVPWFLGVNRAHGVAHWSCRFAMYLGCKNPSNNKLGYIDYATKAWKTCFKYGGWKWGAH